MYIELSKEQAMDLLLKDTNAAWSYEAAEALVEWFEEMEEHDNPMPLDRVAIRCDWTEYDLESVDFDYGHLTNDGGHDERAPSRASREDWDLAKWADFLNDYTVCMKLEDSILVMAF